MRIVFTVITVLALGMSIYLGYRSEKYLPKTDERRSRSIASLVFLVIAVAGLFVVATI